MHIKQNDDWKQIKELFVKQSDEWKRVKYLNVKQNDTWKSTYVGYEPTDIFLNNGEQLLSDPEKFQDVIVLNGTDSSSTNADDHIILEDGHPDSGSKILNEDSPGSTFGYNNVLQKPS